MPYLKEAGIDIRILQTCLGRRDFAQIDADAAEARGLGISGTPTFLLGKRVSGANDVHVVKVLTGALPVDRLEEAIRSVGS
jgi:predicted DsbA family dithiol-disulfide isomerase